MATPTTPTTTTPTTARDTVGVILSDGSVMDLLYDTDGPADVLGVYRQALSTAWHSLADGVRVIWATPPARNTEAAHHLSIDALTALATWSACDRSPMSAYDWHRCGDNELAGVDGRPGREQCLVGRAASHELDRRALVVAGPAFTRAETVDRKDSTHRTRLAVDRAYHVVDRLYSRANGTHAYEWSTIVAYALHGWR